jgi:hypothetical protein
MIAIDKMILIRVSFVRIHAAYVFDSNDDQVTTLIETSRDLGLMARHSCPVQSRQTPFGVALRVFVDRGSLLYPFRSNLFSLFSHLFPE